MTGRARELLAADLEPLLPDFAIVPDPRDLGELDPAKLGWVQIVRANRRANPTAPQAQYLEQMHIWVATPKKAQPEAENDLDDSLDIVREALDSLDRSAIEVEERLTHQSGKHAYRITATYVTEKE